MATISGGYPEDGNNFHYPEDDGDLKLLVPELRLVRFDLVVQLVRLVIELQALLAELKHHDGKQNGGEEAEKELEHGDRMEG